MPTERSGPGMLAVLVFALASPALSAATVSGAAVEVASSIRHPNGNIYDQVLLTGPSATVTNGWSDPTAAARGTSPDKITRIAFVDLNGDIVQVEFSGAG